MKYSSKEGRKQAKKTKQNKKKKPFKLFIFGFKSLQKAPFKQFRMNKK